MAAAVGPTLSPSLPCVDCYSWHVFLAEFDKHEVKTETLGEP